ncbi:hypothetical protein OPT61_g3435 [Boeremia exigua]|uniref:Uncharacterized protein n=1 Tax=Boeremia exigua TaxID=749465 RepID=A0ACC2IHS4_9PLEO|nr:hypothetical protein OPT61_g3435 [Boeremia exigua]
MTLRMGVSQGYIDVVTLTSIHAVEETAALLPSPMTDAWTSFTQPSTPVPNPGYSINQTSLQMTLLPASTPSVTNSNVTSKLSSNSAKVGGILGGIIGSAIVVRIAWILLRNKRHERLERRMYGDENPGTDTTEDARKIHQPGNLYAT